MSASDSWMPLYIADFIAATSHLDTEETGAYLLLLMGAWGRDGVLPNNDSDLARISKCTPELWEVIKPRIEPFFEVTEKYWTQLRLLKEKEKAKHRCAIRSQVGKLGGRPKKTETHETNSLTNSFAEKKLMGGTTTTTGTEITHTSGRGFAEMPSRTEVTAYASQIGLAEWKALDWFNEMEGCGWLDYARRPVQNWTAVIARVKTKWEADGRPAGPPASNNGKSGNGALPAWRQIEILEEQISKHPANKESVFCTKPPTLDQQADLREKRKNLRILKENGLTHA